MALDFIENFADFTLTAGNVATEGYSVPSIDYQSIVAGARAASKALKFDESSRGNWTKSLPSSGATKFFCVRVRNDATGAASSLRAFIEFREAATSHIGLAINNAGQLTVLRGTTQIGAESGARSINEWFQITGKIVVNNSAGSVEIRLNGNPTPIINLSGINTREGGAGVIDTIAIRGPSSLSTIVFSLQDFAVWSDVGDSPNGWVGDVRVDSYNIVGDGASTQWTPSAGNNYECVDEAAQNGDTDYVESNLNGKVDLYTVANMGHTPTNIYGIAVTAVAKKTDSGTAAVKLKMKSGATIETGPANYTSENTYTRYQMFSGANPNTSSAWTKADIDALEVGVESVV